MNKRISHLIKFKNGKLFRITKLFIIFLGLYYVVMGKSSNYFYINSNLPKDIYLLDTPPPILEDFELDIPDTRLGLREFGNPINLSFEISELDTLYNIWKLENASIILNEWIKRYDPIIESREIGAFNYWDLDSFYLRSDSTLFKKILINSNVIDKNIETSFKSVANNRYISNPPKLDFIWTFPIEEIWNDFSLFFTISSYSKPSKSSSADIREILYYSKLNFDTVQNCYHFAKASDFDMALTKTIQIVDENKRFEELFLIWFFLYENNIRLQENDLEPLYKIEYFLNKPNSLSYFQKATWCLVLAKIYAAAGTKYYQVEIENYLSRAFEYIILDDKIHDKKYSENRLKISILRAHLWSDINQGNSQNNARQICLYELKNNIQFMTKSQIKKLYSYISYFQSLDLISSTDLNYRNTSQQQLWCLTNVLHSLHYEFPFILKRNNQCFLALSNLFRSRGEFNLSLYINYEALNYYLNGRDIYNLESEKWIKEYSLRILDDNYELNNQKEISQWSRHLYGDSYDFQKRFYIPKSIRSWNVLHIDTLTSMIMVIPIHEFNYLNDFSKSDLQKKLIYLADHHFKNEKYDLAYKLRLKADSVKFNYSDYLYGLGYSMASAKEFVTTEDLNSKNKKLQLNLKLEQKKLDDIQCQYDSLKYKEAQLKDSIDMYRSALIIANDSLNNIRSEFTKVKDSLGETIALAFSLDSTLLIVQAERDKNRKFNYGLSFLSFFFGVSLISVFLLWNKAKSQTAIATEQTLIANSQTAIAKRQSALNKFKSSMHYLDHHFISNFISSLTGRNRANETTQFRNLLYSFQSLNRTILKQITSEQLTLSDELILVEQYCALNQQILKNFVYQIEYPKEWKEVGEIGFPYGLLQLFCENSIQHGLFYRPRGFIKNLKIKIMIQNSRVEIDITDNGVGRTESTIRRKRLNKTSYGTQIAEDKVSSFNEFTGSNFKYKYIDDILDEFGNCLGVSVKISTDI